MTDTPDTPDTEPADEPAGEPKADDREALDLDLDAPEKAPAPGASSGGFGGGAGPADQSERDGHPIRHYKMAISAAAMALAWARMEDAPDGAAVVVDREVSPLGRHGRLWSVPAESTLSTAVILRPALKVDDADVAWLLAGVAAAEGAAEVSGLDLETWWPDRVVDKESGEEICSIKVEIQLGPGKVRSAIASLRFDLDRLGLGADERDELHDAVLAALTRHGASLSEGPQGVAAAYEGRCRLVGRRVKIRLMPKGEMRGTVRSVSSNARLELESTTGMVQRVAIETLRELDGV